MEHAALSHKDSNLVTRAELMQVAAPEPTGTWKPIPHYELVDMLDRTLTQQGIHVEKEEFALRRDGAVLFGVLELAWGQSQDGKAALGLRTANDKSLSIQICAGLAVFVCDNLAFRGDLIALRRKHTSGLHLREELAGAVLRFQDHFGQLTGEIDALKGRELRDLEAKAMIHDVFVKGMMPLRLLPEASRAYFEPTIPAFEPRTAWSLHNAFTSAAKAMPITTRLPAIQSVGKLFGMTTKNSG